MRVHACPTGAALAAAAVVFLALSTLVAPSAGAAGAPRCPSKASGRVPKPTRFSRSRPCTWFSRGRGNATQLGQFTEEGDFFVNFLFLSGCGTEVLTAANGDTVNAAGCGQATPTAHPGVVSIEEQMVITGGTGRFAGATGSFTRVRVRRRHRFEHRFNRGDDLVARCKHALKEGAITTDGEHRTSPSAAWLGDVQRQRSHSVADPPRVTTPNPRLPPHAHRTTATNVDVLRPNRRSVRGDELKPPRSTGRDRRLIQLRPI